MIRLLTFSKIECGFLAEKSISIDKQYSKHDRIFLNALKMFFTQLVPNPYTHLILTYLVLPITNTVFSPSFLVI